MNWLKNKIQNEKGSITLYVLVTMMLFLSVVLVTYIQSRNKNSTQLQQLGEIQKEYQSNDIDDIYEETETEYKGEINVTFYTPDGKVYNINEWTNQDLTMKITYPYDVKESDRYYYLDGERIKYTDNETIVENCVISTEYKGKTQDIHITKIDKKPATVTFDKNGDQYLLGENQTQTAVTTKITADDGEGSGVQKVEYQITTSTTEPAVDSDQWKEINKEQTIAEQKPGGIYYVYAKVTDNVGNVEIYRSNKFEVNYQVIYDVNGGTGAPASQVKVHGTNLTLTTQKPSKAGYEFIGWGTSANDTTVDYNPGGTYIANATIRLYAIYRKTIVATFNYYDEGAKSTTISEDIFNNETSVEITAPTIANVSRDGITLTGRGWSTDKSQTANIELKANEKVTISANSAYYASYSGTITGTFNYYDGSKAAKATSSATRYMNYEGTYTQNNISIPEEVTGSKGPASTTYSHVSTTKTGEGTTPSTELGAINYYAVYKKTVTATLYTHNNQKTTKQGTAYGYYDGTTANASINLGTASLSGYTARGWSTENTGNANINVALNGNASILNDTTYYMSYSYTVTATYYYYNGSSYTSSKQTATAYMNYVGTKIGAKPTTPTVSNPSGWTGRGWSTSSSATGATTTPGTITADATYYYSWSKSVTLTYNANGGSGAPAQETKTAYLNYAGSPTNASFTVSSTIPTRTGYTFQNWNTASNGSGTTYNAGANISTTNNTTLNAIWKINTYKIDLNFYVDGTPYWSGYQGTRIKAGLKINGVDKGYVTDYGTSHEYGSTWEVYGVELDGVKVAYSKTGTLTSTFSLNLEFNTMKFVANNSSYGTVSSSELIIAKGNKYSTSGTTLTLADGRKVTAAVTNATGYTTTFSSWSPASGTVNAATTVTANFSRTINSYYVDLNLKVNGSAYGTGYNNRITVGLKIGGVDQGYVQDYYKQHTYGTTWEIYGAKLDGVQVAYTASGTVGAANTSISPEFNTITFKSNNTSYGTVSSSELLIVKGRTFSTSGTTLTLQDGRKVTATVKNATGYTTKLSSWSPASGTVNAATTVTANFSRTINSYTVTYNFSENGGQSATKTSATVNYGAAIDLTPTASKSGYTFIGWNTNKDATSKLSSLNMGTSNVTLYAIYSKTITATFNYSGGSKSVSGTMYNKATTVSIQAPDVTDTASANGVTFNIRGWSTSSAANAVIELNNNASKALSNNTTYYASYSATITATLYTYNNQKTAKTGTAYLNYAGSVTNASIPLGTTSLSGYSFRGWSTSTAANAGITVAANGTASINKNTTYYASYSYTVTATLYTYNNQRTTKTGTAYMGYTGSKINASIGLGTTSLSGYSFRGWSTSNAANASITVGANGTASINTNTTYYASYSYTVTATYYYYNGSSYTSSKTTATGYMNYTGGKLGAKPTTPSVSNPSGWTGRGWSTSSSATGATTTPGTITGNATYYYSWSKSVTLSYNANGGSGAPGSSSKTAYRNYAGSITNASFTVSSTTPTRAGWTFQGWSTSSSATSASYKGGSTIGISTNTTLYAVWKDTIAPTMGTLTANTTAWTNGNVILTGKATDIGSGISYYQFSTNGSLTASSGGWTSITNTKSEISRTYTVSSNGTYYFYAKDAAGNINKKSIVVSNIDKTAPTISNLARTTEPIQSGLQVNIDASQNVGASYNAQSTTWKNLSGTTTNSGILNNFAIPSTTTSGWKNTYLQFDGVDDYVSLEVINNDYQTYEITFSADSIGSQMILICNWDEGGGGIYITSDGYIAGNYWINNSVRDVVSNVKVTAGQVYTVDLTYDGSTIKLYINGSLNKSLSVSGKIQKGNRLNTRTLVGCNPFGGGIQSDDDIGGNNNLFKGKVYSARVYNRGLSATEVLHNYNTIYGYRNKVSVTFQDTASGVVGYQSSNSSNLTASSSGWTSITQTTASKTISDIVQTPSNNKYFYVKDKAGNVSKLSLDDVTHRTITYNQNYTTTTGIANNLLEGLANASTVNGGTNGSDTSNARMSYSVSNGVVTVTAKVNDGYGYTTGRAYLERGKTYIFNCTTNGTWKSASSGDSVEAFLMMSGSTSYEYLRMETNNNFEFTVAETGYYWLRLDVNGAGITHTFSNITIKEKNALNSQSKPVGSQIGSMPIPSRMDYEFDGWYTAASGGTKVTQSTIMSSSNLTLYAHWKSAPTEITYYLSGANGTKQDSGTGNNNMAGATGQNLVNYGLMTTISNRRFSGNIFAEAHQSTSGWLLKMPDGIGAGYDPWAPDGFKNMLQAVSLSLTGDLAKNYDIYYKVHCQNYGWLGWAKNGQRTGTTGYGYRLEAIKIRLVKKGEKAPAEADGSGSTIIYSK